MTGGGRDVRQRNWFHAFVMYTFRETYALVQPLLPQTRENVRIHHQMEMMLERRENNLYRMVLNWDAHIKQLEKENNELKEELAKFKNQ